MDDTYDWVGDHFPIKNNTTYGQIHNNFTAGVAGSVYNTVDMVTSLEYLGAKAYSAAAQPKQILAAANMSGRDAVRGLQGVAGKIKNKEYGSLARSAGYVAGSAAQAYALGKGIEKCGDLINKKKYGTGTYADGMPLEDATASLGGSDNTKDVIQYEKLKAEYAANEIVNAERVGSGLKVDPTHRAASYVSESQLAQGRVFSFTGGDNSSYTLLQTKGGLDGINGIYEYILNIKGQVTHQRFITGGQITGFANQKVPIGGY